MTNDAMKQAWEHHRLYGLRPIPTWEEIVEGVEERAFAAGWRARDAEVAKLKQELADVYRAYNGGDGITQSIGDTAQYPPPPKDNDPLAISVERLRERVAEG